MDNFVKLEFIPLLQFLYIVFSSPSTFTHVKVIVLKFYVYFIGEKFQ